MNAYAHWNKFSEAEELCLRRFVPQQARIVDLGCGTGRALYALRDSCSEYFGMDASEAMIRKARMNHPKAHFSVGDIVECSFEPHSFDVALLLHNVIDMLNPKTRRARLLRNVKGLLKRDGVLIASSHLRNADQIQGYYEENYHGATIYNYRSSFPEWCAEVEAAGFRVLFAMRDFRGVECDWTYLTAGTN